MSETANLLIKLQDLSQFLASGNLADDMVELAALTARLVGAESCSIMLVSEGEPGDLRLKLCANAGPLPPAAWGVSIGKGDGIAGHVLVTGRALLVEDIAQSDFAHLARRSDDPRRSLMIAPVRIDTRMVGMINVCAASAGKPFAAPDLHLLEAIALFVGKSIQVQQLQNILNSRFTQLALMQEIHEKVGGTIAATAYQHPADVARILAKSLFKEMTRAGFGSSDIIAAASEIISQLNGKLRQLSAHAARHDGAHPQEPQE